MRTSALGLVTGLGAAFLCALSLSGAVAAPAVAATGGAASSVRCTSAGNCSAIGTLTQANGARQGLLLDQINGKWQPEELLAPPSGAAARPSVVLNDLWCARGPDCVAVGDYDDRSGNQQALVVTSHHGVWTRATRVSLPGGAIGGGNQLAELNSVWCSSASDCVAVGDLTDRQANQQGLTVTEKHGKWSRGSETPVPSDAAGDPQVALTALDCASVSACDAVGIYSDQAGNQEGEVLAGSPSDWGDAELILPDDAAAAAQQVQLNALACARTRDCVGVGAFIEAGGNEQPLILHINGDSFSTLQPALPANADATSNPEAGLTSVWCANAGNCTSVGDYNDADSNQQGLLLSETNGSLAQSSELTLPVDAGASDPGGNPQVTLNAVWCTQPGTWAAAGGYSNAVGAELPLTVTESSGAWGHGRSIGLPRGAAAAANQSASLSSLWCASATSCSAVGAFTGASGAPEPLLVAGRLSRWGKGTRPPSPSPTPGSSPSR